VAGDTCPRPGTALWLRVRAPYQARVTRLPFDFQACPHAGVLVAGPLQAGVGLP
jgi:hypothetical protein